jgi:tetratricopeptide (TPR) repeat protein
MTPATACHNDAELRAFALGTDTEDEAAAVEGHLSACPSCLRRLGGLHLTDDLLVALRCLAPADVPDIPSDQVETLIARLRSLGGCDGSAIPGASQAETEVQAGSPSGTEPPVHPLPEAFGRYRVRHVLGVGGMGAVYVAEDPALGRLVAVKVPRPEWFGGAPERAQARFLREARAAAHVRHPNVCAVHDAGTQDGLPYVVLDLIEGPSLHERLRQGPPVEPRQAVEWARQLSEALGAVHATGMSHRDVKPGNVLLAPDGRAVLSDFGVARPNDAEPLTADGQLVGTPAYMSPERLAGEGGGPRADLYALGLVLYQTLTGVLPFDGPAPCDAVPPAPSRRRPGLDPRLDAITLTALAPRPEERYASAREFADDLARYLGQGAATAEKRPATVRVELPDGRPVTVQVAEGVPEGGKVRVSVRERPAKKGRARWAVTVLVTFCLMLAIAGIGQVSYLAYQASQVKLERNVSYQKARRPQGLKEAKELSDLAGNHNHLGVLLEAQGQRGEARKHYEEAREVYSALAEAHPDVPKYQSDLASTHNNLGVLLAALGERGEARKQYEEARKIRAALVAAHPEVPQYRSDLAATYHNLGNLLAGLGEYEQARKQYEVARTIRTALAQAHPNVPQSLSDLAATHHNLALCLESLGRSSEALPLYRHALAIRQKALGEAHPDTATSYANLALCLQSLGRSAEALQLQEKVLAIRKEALGEKHPDYATSLNNLAMLYQAKGEHAKALPLFEKALKIRKEALGEKHPDYATSLNNLAMLYQLGRGVPKDEKKAAEWYQQAADKGNATAMNNLGTMYENGRGVPKDEARAAKLYQEAASKGDADAMANLAWLCENGRGVERSDRRAAVLYAEAAEKGHARAMANLGALYETGRGVEQDEKKALEWYKKAAERGDENAKKKVEELSRKQ